MAHNAGRKTGSVEGPGLRRLRVYWVPTKNAILIGS